MIPKLAGAFCVLLSVQQQRAALFLPLPGQRKFHKLRCFRLADQRFFFVQCGETCHFLGGQRKIEQRKVFADMGRLGASRNHGDALLCQEAELDLRRGLAVLFSKGEHSGLFEHFAAVSLTKRGVGHVRHPAFVHPAALGGALAIEVRLNLVDGRDDLVVGDQIQKLVRLKVGNADGPDFAFCIQLFQAAPSRA